MAHVMGVRERARRASPRERAGRFPRFFNPKLKNCCSFNTQAVQNYIFWCPKPVLEASQRGFWPKMPRFVAADVSFDRFIGFFRSGSKVGWKLPEKGFKMVSPWPQWAKKSPQGVFRTKGPQMAHFMVVRLRTRRAFPRERAGRFPQFFYPKLKNLLHLQHAGHLQLIFWCPKPVLEASKRDF